MTAACNARCVRLASFFLIALSLSIGWGIRGNFGHEAGAMIAGVLSGIAACLLSGRKDWHPRVVFFAFFGGIGWAFGGSISYMYPISFLGSEQWATAAYGFFATFLVGFLWAGLGGMGTALPAVLERERLNRFLAPVAFVLLIMAISDLWIHPWLADHLVIPGANLSDVTWNRHHNPLYWLDADWFAAVVALTAVCLYDLVNRRFQKGTRLLLFTGIGVLLGGAGYALLEHFHLIQPLFGWLVVPLGDASALNPATGLPYGSDAFLSNWPNFVHYYPHYMGPLLGACIGAALYFRRWGTWNNDSGFILYLAGGWLLAFLMLPVLGSIPLQSFGGLRLTPPRSDDWAGIVGVFTGGSLYCLRRNLQSVAYTASLTGILGGFGFAFVPFARSFLRLPGHPLLTPGGTPLFWEHYQSANWHSVMEQSHGFCHGLALAIAIAFLAKSTPKLEDPLPKKRLPEGFSVAFVLLFITLMNVFKNVEEWTKESVQAVPLTMKAPFFASWNWSAQAWFLLIWTLLSAVLILLMIWHTRKALPVVPASYLARGQLLYLTFLWIMVIANFERALVSFHESRLVTEAVIIFNAGLASLLILLLPQEEADVTVCDSNPFPGSLKRLWLRAIPLLICLLLAMTAALRLAYRDQPVENPSTNHKRWGEEAQWRIRPILKGGRHL